MSNSNQEYPSIFGGWSTYNCKIDEAAQIAFKEAMKDFVGVSYSPVAVAQQLVAGMNYKFFCNATPVVLHPFHYAAVVSVYKPLDKPAILTGIHYVS